MFYRPGQEDHGLAHNPFKAIVSPRPIGWISTRSAAGVDNLAPYSFFNALNDTPPMVMFSSNGSKPGETGGKDSLTNIRETGVFCVNIVSYALKDQMNISSGFFPLEQDEFDAAGLEKAQAQSIDAPFVAAAPAVLECKSYSITELPGNATMVIGEVIGIHLKPEFVIDGMFDVTKFQPLARLGYKDYSAVTQVFPLARPEQK